MATNVNKLKRSVIEETVKKDVTFILCSMKT